ncbi:MAG: glycosyltransferase [Candidatus Methanoperedens sp.]|nr:glycosyltransferase [Candidatus Methanoperedens sp.]MCZ7370653.1 glycosyltransferase [Candidatus Methanoperedens sp.]
MKNDKLSVIIPAYNEEGHILKTIMHVKDLFTELGVDHEIIVVDDGSTDNTYEEATSKRFDNVNVVQVKHNMGKGNAIRYGLKFATRDLVTFLDADMELDPKQISILLEYMKKYHADIVVGSKRHPLSTIEYYPLIRKFLSKMYNIILRLLLQLEIRDTQAGFKLMRREVLQKVFPLMRVKRYAFDVELLAYARRFGYKIVEAPIILKFTRKGWGRINIKVITNIFLDTVAVAGRFGFLQYYSRIIRDSTIMLMVSISGIYLYKQFIDPFLLPGIESRSLIALFALSFVIVILTLPYESLARKFEK